MKRLIGAVLATVLFASPVAAGPLLESGIRAARQTAAPAPAVDNGASMMVSGVALLGAGVLLEVLSVTALKKETSGCVFGAGGAFYCVTETGRNNPIFWTGWPLAVVGGFMLDIGYNRHKKARTPSIRFDPNGVRIVQTFTF